MFAATLTTVVCAILQNCRGEDAIGQWLSKQPMDFLHALGFWRSPPTASALRKLLSKIDVTALEDVLTSWITPVLPDETPSVGPIPISLDGKSPNATVRAWVGHVSDHILAIDTRVLDGLSQSEFSGFRPQRRQPDLSPSPKDSES